MAVLEAMRCLGCKNRPCVEGCPVSIDIPRFIARIQERDYRGALSVIQEESILPSICGRVCPQESQCQKHCTVGKALKDVDKAVGIGRLERFVADWCSEDESVPEVKGHEVVMYEALHKSGGVLSYGIPEFRLPKRLVDREISRLEKMGVRIERNVLVGRTRTIAELREEDAREPGFRSSWA